MYKRYSIRDLKNGFYGIWDSQLKILVEDGLPSYQEAQRRISGWN